MGKRERRERERVCGFFILSPWQTRSRMREERGDGKKRRFGEQRMTERERDRRERERERGRTERALYHSVETQVSTVTM